MGLRGSPGAAVRLHLQRSTSPASSPPRERGTSRLSAPRRTVQAAADQPGPAGGRRARSGSAVQPAAHHGPDRRARGPPDRPGDRAGLVGHPDRGAGLRVRRQPAGDRARTRAGDPPEPGHVAARPGRRPGVPAACAPLPRSSSTTACACRCCGCSPTCGSGRRGCCRPRSRRCRRRSPSSTSTSSPWRRSGTSRSAPSAPHRWPGSPPTWPGRASWSRRSATSSTSANPSKSDQRQRIQVTRVAGRARPDHPGVDPHLARRPARSGCSTTRDAGGQHAAGRGAGGRTSVRPVGRCCVWREHTCRRSGRAPAGTTGPRTSASAPRSASGRPACGTRP